MLVMIIYEGHETRTGVLFLFYPLFVDGLSGFLFLCILFLFRCNLYTSNMLYQDESKLCMIHSNLPQRYLEREIHDPSTLVD